MDFKECEPLEGEDLSFWRRTTESYLREVVMAEYEEDRLYQLTVTIDENEVEQQPVNGEEADGDVGRRLQRRQLVIIFAIKLKFKSPEPNIDFEGIFGGSFDTIEYIDRLQSSEREAFVPINSVEVKINNKLVSIKNPDDQGIRTSTPDYEFWIIGGSSAGGAVCLGVAAAILLRRRRRFHKDNTSAAYYVGSDERASSPGRHASARTINLEPHGPDDISTLGDPVYPGGGMIFSPHIAGGSAMMMDGSGDFTDGYDTNTYDYGAAYGGTGEHQSASSAGAVTNLTGSRNSYSHGGAGTDSVTNFSGSRYGNSTSTANHGGGGSSGSSRSLHGSSRTLGARSTNTMSVSEAIFTDDTSFDRRFASESQQRIEVHAPPGKLGMVVDAPNGGMPVVHAIKETSVLADKIRIGDKLLSVDDEDVTTMSALKVSKLISSRASRPNRTLVFARDGRPGTRR